MDRDRLVSGAQKQNKGQQAQTINSKLHLNRKKKILYLEGDKELEQAAQ